MALIHRLIGKNPTDEALPFSDVRLPIHESLAFFGEILRGKLTLAEAATRFELHPSEVAELQEWMISWAGAIGSGAFNTAELKDVLVLGESGYYSVSEVYARLGLDEESAPTSFLDK